MKKKDYSFLPSPDCAFPPFDAALSAPPRLAEFELATNFPGSCVGFQRDPADPGPAKAGRIFL